jgi:hypothetical protein
MRFMLVKTGGRKFRCIDCEVPDENAGDKKAAHWRTETTRVRPLN